MRFTHDEDQNIKYLVDTSKTKDLGIRSLSLMLTHSTTTFGIKISISGAVSPFWKTENILK